MPAARSLASQRKRVLQYALLLAIPCGGLLLVYLGYTYWVSQPFYAYVKASGRGWSGVTHRADPVLGLAPIPGAQGAHVFPVGPGIPMRYDADGYRVPVIREDHLPVTGPKVLALGGSFTYGDACYAMDAYPYLVAARLGGHEKNAGVGSYGLAQILLRGRMLIPEEKPDIVLVQYSRWLVERAMTPFAPAAFGKVPCPYFYGSETLAIQPPVFLTAVLGLPRDRYRATPEGIGDILSFVWRVGLPLRAHDDFCMNWYRIEKTLGWVPRPTQEREALIRLVYEELGALTRAHGGTMIVVALGNNVHPVRIPRPLLPEGAIVVDAHQALLDALPVQDLEIYQARYGHWRGEPPQLVDIHPNPEAHAIIAGAVVEGLKRAE
jgi:hypothetical protein